MKIAIMGTRGIPARYGGFETLAEALSVRFVASGYRVTVYCRKKYSDQIIDQYKGVDLKYVPAIYFKYFETVTHTLCSVIHDVFCGRSTHVLLCNSANAVFIPLLKLFRKRVIINVDGLEWKRRKWNICGKWWYKLGEKLAVKYADTIVTDARVIEDYYKKVHGSRTVFIAYGADVICGEDTEYLSQLGLENEKYILYVGRLEPENNADKVMEAYKKVDTQFHLVLVGDAPYSAIFKKRLNELLDDKIILSGAVYGEKYWTLLSNALFCINATEVGGTHPAIVEAMAAGKMVLANDVPENCEVIGDTGIPFSIGACGDLEKKIERSINDPELISLLGKRARERVSLYYSWDTITKEYIDVLIGSEP
ncbi:MAG: DUF1972 domain-containing protein [Candidatus Ancaeobacter aquaticus]|nr:DUF1972 domain-containing protein [Candidatus Ancaeobacter aquaticus]